jgi:chloramphenicol O-acetyltransferase type A
MRIIDLASWPRRAQFEFFMQFDHPHFSLCANVEITHYVPAVRQRGLSATAAIAHLLSAAANAIPEFRTRIRRQDGQLQVVEHEQVHPSFTILTEAELFSFCTVSYEPDLTAFSHRAAELIRRVKVEPVLEDHAGQDDLLFMTGLPWVAFTSMTHPIRLDPTDSTPRIAWGKFFTQNERLWMPLGVQAHHGLMDGLHVGRFYEAVQHRLDAGPG